MHGLRQGADFSEPELHPTRQEKPVSHFPNTLGVYTFQTRQTQSEKTWPKHRCNGRNTKVAFCKPLFGLDASLLETEEANAESEVDLDEDGHVDPRMCKRPISTQYHGYMRQTLTRP